MQLFSSFFRLIYYRSTTRSKRPQFPRQILRLFLLFDTIFYAQSEEGSITGCQRRRFEHTLVRVPVLQPRPLVDVDWQDQNVEQ